MCPENVFFIKENKFIFVLISWVSLQVLILTIQELFGPRCFLPKRLFPETYNYHPFVSVGDEESGASEPRISTNSSIDENRNLGGTETVENSQSINESNTAQPDLLTRK
ncbi:DSC E3 ubiquitin ligase complex subunit 1 [Smittium culicis]|uniref:RING-type E3 ubiquitin transferase n=1 Tax=Smittium culicis TaxID=133412 RepID=A0A1R1Y5N4_9FUNG|nr:DSC E3 ubiquitin ligase complex subunit 1 [Smittium culicis]